MNAEHLSARMSRSPLLQHPNAKNANGLVAEIDTEERDGRARQKIISSTRRLSKRMSNLKFRQMYRSVDSLRLI